LSDSKKGSAEISQNLRLHNK